MALHGVCLKHFISFSFEHDTGARCSPAGPLCLGRHPPASAAAAQRRTLFSLLIIFFWIFTLVLFSGNLFTCVSGMELGGYATYGNMCRFVAIILPVSLKLAHLLDVCRQLVLLSFWNQRRRVNCELHQLVHGR